MKYSNNGRIRFCFLFFSFLLILILLRLEWQGFGATVLCQEKKSVPYKPLKLDRADLLENAKIQGQDVLKATGNVRFSQDTVVVHCDRAVYFKDKDVAIIRGHVRIRDGRRILVCKQATYYAKLKKAICRDDVVIFDTPTTLVADSVTYFQKTKIAHANSNVVVFDSLESATLYSDEVFYDYERQYSKATGRPYLIQNDTTIAPSVNVALLSRGLVKLPTDSGGARHRPEDQIFIKGQIIESFIDSAKVYVRDSVQIVRNRSVITSKLAEYYTRSERLTATDSVKIVRDALTVKADTVIYRIQDAELQLNGKPVGWFKDSKVSGNVMLVELDGNDVRTITVRGNAVSTTRVDTIANDPRLNRLKARELVMHVAENKLHQVDAAGNAYNVYYLENGDGVNEITGPFMTLYFTDGKLKQFLVSGGSEGTYFPARLENRVKGN